MMLNNKKGLRALNRYKAIMLEALERGYDFDELKAILQNIHKGETLFMVGKLLFAHRKYPEDFPSPKDRRWIENEDIDEYCVFYRI
jgi:hypothetical protein